MYDYAIPEWPYQWYVLSRTRGSTMHWFRLGCFSEIATTTTAGQALRLRWRQCPAVDEAASNTHYPILQYPCNDHDGSLH